MSSQSHLPHCRVQSRTHSLTAALDQLRVVASSTSNDPGPRSGQHQQIGQCLLPLVAANFFVDDPAGACSQRREECWCRLLVLVWTSSARKACVFSGRRQMWPNNEWRLSAIRDRDGTSGSFVLSLTAAWDTLSYYGKRNWFLFTIADIGNWNCRYR